MILEIVEFNTPEGWTRDQVAEDARHVIAKWRANPDLVRKHFGLTEDGKACVAVYIWPDKAAADAAHNEAWRQGIIAKTGAAPTRRFLDFFLLIDNEHAAVTEYPANP